MVGMQIDNGEFHVVTVEERRQLFNEEEEAIQHLEDNVSNIDPESDEVSIVQVSVDEDEWSIAEMPWQEIALRLLQE